eukprot:4589205-Amphidinium_carterae.4
MSMPTSLTGFPRVRCNERQGTQLEQEQTITSSALNRMLSVTLMLQEAINPFESSKQELSMLFWLWSCIMHKSPTRGSLRCARTRLVAGIRQVRECHGNIEVWQCGAASGCQE